jgi:chromate transporter
MAERTNSPDAPAAKLRPTSLWALFSAFSRLSLMGFGGVLPIAQRVLVERLHWLSVSEFAELLALGQVLPGPNVVNLSLMIGDRYFGWRGAMAALAGMLALPLVLVLAMAAAYSHWAHLAVVSGAVRGMGVAAAGMVIATGFKLLPALATNPLGRVLWAPLVAGTVLAVGWWRVPLLAVILVGGGLGVGLAWWRLRPKPDSGSEA